MYNLVFAIFKLNIEILENHNNIKIPRIIKKEK